MKELFLIFLNGFCTSLHSFGEENKIPVPMVNNKVIYSDTVKIDSSNRDLLIKKAKSWLENTFKLTGGSVQMDKEDSGTLIGNGTIKKFDKFGFSGTIMSKTWTFIIKINVGDSQYVAQIYDINYSFSLSGEIKNIKPGQINIDQYFNNHNEIYNKEGNINPFAKILAEETNSNCNSVLNDLSRAMHKLE